MTADMQTERSKVREQLDDLLKDEDVKDEYVRHVNDRAIARYLMARKGDTTKAAEAIREMLKYRKENRVQAIVGQDFENVGKLGKVYISPGRGRFGEPLIVCSLGEWPSDTQGMIKMLIYYLEKADAIMGLAGRLTDRWIWMIDLEDFGVSSIPSSGTIKSLGEVLGLLYADRVAHMYLCGPGYFFAQGYSLLEEAIPVGTRKKISVVERGALNFVDHIDREQLEERFGGKLKYKYDFYLEEMNENALSKFRSLSQPVAETSATTEEVTVLVVGDIKAEACGQTCPNTPALSPLPPSAAGVKENDVTSAGQVSVSALQSSGELVDSISGSSSSSSSGDSISGCSDPTELRREESSNGAGFWSKATTTAAAKDESADGGVGKQEQAASSDTQQPAEGGAKKDEDCCVM